MPARECGYGTAVSRTYPELCDVVEASCARAQSWHSELLARPARWRRACGHCRLATADRSPARSCAPQPGSSSRFRRPRRRKVSVKHGPHPKPSGSVPASQPGTNVATSPPPNRSIDSGLDKCRRVDGKVKAGAIVGGDAERSLHAPSNASGSGDEGGRWAMDLGPRVLRCCQLGPGSGDHLAQFSS